jgi:hypothetical protein
MKRSEAVAKLDEYLDKDKEDILKFVQNPDKSIEALLLEIYSQGRRMGWKISQLDNKIESLREVVNKASRRIRRVSWFLAVVILVIFPIIVSIEIVGMKYLGPLSGLLDQTLGFNVSTNK